MKTKIGDITMENELLRERPRRAEANHPFVSRRSRPWARPARSPPTSATVWPHLPGARDPTLDGDAARARERKPRARKSGPKTSWTDAELTERVREVLAPSPWLGEGYRKAWARLRRAEIRTSKAPVLRLMRETGCWRRPAQATPMVRRHDGTITTDRPDMMWGPTPPEASLDWTHQMAPAPATDVRVAAATAPVTSGEHVDVGAV